MSAPLPLAPAVFVHGGAHGAWCWEPLLPFLDGDALAVDLPPKSVRGGARRLEPVPELRTLTVGDFADSVLRDIDGAASKITVEGARYPEHLERMTGR